MTANGLVEGCLQFNQTIVSINEIASREQRIILPGMIDCHIHGGGGGMSWTDYWVFDPLVGRMHSSG